MLSCREGLSSDHKAEEHGGGAAGPPGSLHVTGLPPALRAIPIWIRVPVIPHLQLSWLPKAATVLPRGCKGSLCSPKATLSCYAAPHCWGHSGLWGQAPDTPSISISLGTAPCRDPDATAKGEMQVAWGTRADQVPSGVSAGLHCPQGSLTMCTHLKQLLLEVGLRPGAQGHGDTRGLANTVPELLVIVSKSTRPPPTAQGPHGQAKLLLGSGQQEYPDLSGKEAVSVAGCPVHTGRNRAVKGTC